MWYALSSIPYFKSITVGVVLALMSVGYSYSKWRTHKIEKLTFEVEAYREATRKLGAAIPIIRRGDEERARVKRQAARAAALELLEDQPLSACPMLDEFVERLYELENGGGE